MHTGVLCILFFIIELNPSENSVKFFLTDFKEHLGFDPQTVFAYMMRSSKGGFTYSDLMSMCWSDIMDYNNALSKQIEAENKANKREMKSG